MKYKVYATDEGFGPLIRQGAIYKELKRLCPEIQIILQTKNHIKQVPWVIPDAKLITKYNLVSWAKKEDGSPDIQAIKDHFENYNSLSNDFISNEISDSEEFSFIVSDFVYEAFEIGSKTKTPVYGTSHFVWDWFFSKIYPTPVSTRTLRLWENYARQAKMLFFPPFTPQEILGNYDSIIKNVPFIVREGKGLSPEFTFSSSSKKRVMILDSGSRVLHGSIRKLLDEVDDFDNIHFYVSNQFQSESENITIIPQGQLIVDWIPYMDLVISRGGYNTISECLFSRTPMLLFSENLNPEMDFNLLTLKNEGLATFISMDRFRKNFKGTIYSFFENEYDLVKKNIEEHDYKFNGAEVIAETILNDMKA